MDLLVINFGKEIVARYALNPKQTKSNSFYQSIFFEFSDEKFILFRQVLAKF
jgi:hypothetical protein